MEPQQQKMG